MLNTISRSHPSSATTATTTTIAVTTTTSRRRLEVKQSLDDDPAILSL